MPFVLPARTLLLAQGGASEREQNLSGPLLIRFSPQRTQRLISRGSSNDVGGDSMATRPPAQNTDSPLSPPLTN
jgi:hypothetical protein